MRFILATAVAQVPSSLSSPSSTACSSLSSSSSSSPLPGGEAELVLERRGEEELLIPTQEPSPGPGLATNRSLTSAILKRSFFSLDLEV